MAVPIATVCLIHSTLAPAFAALGLRVTSLDPPAGAASLPELLAGLPQPPDCVIHQEHLAKRLVLTDLEHAPCPTVFWARDPHLNFFWQRHYARLFGAVACTQPHLTEAFRAAGAARPAWVTWHGSARPFVPFAKRTTALGFAGRITPERRRRQWFAEHLARFGLAARDNVFGPALADFYDSVRVAPNESIAGEVNLRLFEAASSGCLVVSERVPEAVAELFAPGREALFFSDVLELDEHLRSARSRPDAAEAMGRAAQAAVASRHLAEHRARRLLELATQAGSGAAWGQEAAASLGLTLFALWRAGQLALSPAALWQRLLEAPPTPEVMAALLQVALAGGRREAVLELAAACLANPALAASLPVAAACCLAACRLGEMAAARRAYLAWAAAKERRQVREIEDTYDYLLVFAAAFVAAGTIASPGMPFDPAVHLPADAVQCLAAAQAARPGDLESCRRLEASLRRLPGAQAERVGLLSHLTLHRRDDWSLGLELGLADLQAFRREAGLEEVALAAETATRLGQGDRFARRLAQLDPSGRLRRALAEKDWGAARYRSM